uniref:Ribonuclease H-like domain-containing protein n=1 Tax=Tanacetum cinerariifolium TaxID=118510 RepID=A0A6L2LHW4_TANCI|nr:ribonuclease H-like domain-containing protein [Tanacetum cinerariifolium]
MIVPDTNLVICLLQDKLTSRDKSLDLSAFKASFTENCFTKCQSLSYRLRLSILKNLYVSFGILFDLIRYYKDGDCTRMMRRPRQVNRVHILDFKGLTPDIRQDLAERIRLVYIGDDGQEGLFERCSLLYLHQRSGSKAVSHVDPYSIFKKGHAYKKVTATNLFYLCSMDRGAANIPYLLAQYLFRHAKGKKSGARLSRGHFIRRLAHHFGLVSDDGLRGLSVVTREIPLIDMLQKIVSQLAILGENISQEDLNMKFLRSLPAEWNTHVVVRRNKPDIEIMSFDDLYNNFKIVKQEIKRIVVSSSSSGSSKLTFLSSPYSTNEVDTTSIQVSTASTPINTVSSPNNTANLSDATVYAFLANQPNRFQLVHEDLEQIHKDDLEEIDLKWECKSIRNQESRPRNQDSSRKAVIVEDTSSKAMVAIDGAGFNWSYLGDDEVPTNMALMAFSDSDVHNSKTYSNTYLKSFETLKNQYENLRIELNKYEFDLAKYKRGLFAPPTIDLSNYGLEEFKQPEFESYRPKASKSVYVDTLNIIKKVFDASVIEDWVSDCDEDESEKVAEKSMTSAVGKQGSNVIKSSVFWVWRPKIKGDPQAALRDTGIFNSGYSRHMTENKSFLSNYQEYDRGFAAFVGSSKGVLLKVPRKNNMYSFDLKNVVPSKGLTCLFAKDTNDESNLWHRRVGHINFKTMNKLVKGNLVRGLPLKIFENDHTFVACKKGKQHKASLKRIFRYLKGHPTLGLWYPKDSTLELISYSDSDYAGIELKGYFLNDDYADLVQHASDSVNTAGVFHFGFHQHNKWSSIHQDVNQKEVDIVERAITTDASLEAVQDSDNITKTQTTVMPNVDIPQGIDTGGRPRHQETIGDTSAQTRSKRVLEQPNELPFTKGHTSGSREDRLEENIELTNTVPIPHDSPLTGGYTHGSDEGSITLAKLMETCTILSNMVTQLETKLSTTKAVYNKAFITLTNRVKKLESQLKKKRSKAIIHFSNKEGPSVRIKDSPRHRRIIKEMDKDEKY